MCGFRIPTHFIMPCSLSFPHILYPFICHTQDHATRLNRGSTSGGGSFAAACSQLPPSSHTVPSERHWTPGRPIPSPGHLTNLYMNTKSSIRNYKITIPYSICVVGEVAEFIQDLRRCGVNVLGVDDGGGGDAGRLSQSGLLPSPLRARGGRAAHFLHRRGAMRWRCLIRLPSVVSCGCGAHS